MNAAREAARAPGEDARRRLAWLAAGILAAAVSCWAMYQEIAAYRHPTVILAGQDFWNNTWLALRQLMAGADIYAPVHAVVPGIEPAWPASPHVPASLLWQAPFAAMPIPVALFAFTLASILAIWAGIFVLVRPTVPWDVVGTAACGAFALSIGGGPETLLLGQPTGFMLLGLAILVRGRRPWLAGLGFMLAATTLQTGLPLAIALLVLNGWPVLWRGMTLILGCSALPVGLEIANSGLGRLVTSFTASAAVHLGRQSNRIDLGVLLRALGVGTVGLQVAAGIALLGGCLAYIATLPHEARRIDNPPVLSLVVSVTLLCTYHQYYDMLLVGGGVAPLILIVDRSWRMLPCFGLAVVGATLAAYEFRDVTTPLCLAGLALGSALAAWKITHGDTAADAPALIVAGQPTSWQVS